MDYKYHFSVYDKEKFEKFILNKQCFDKLVLLYKHDDILYYMGEMTYEDELKYYLTKNYSDMDKIGKAYYYNDFWLNTNIENKNIYDVIDDAKGNVSGNIYIYDELYLDNIKLKKNENLRNAMILSDFLNMEDIGTSYAQELYYNNIKYIKIDNSNYFHPQILLDNLSNGFIFALLF